jgi:SAM-dependent methyltransferase
MAISVLRRARRSIGRRGWRGAASEQWTRFRRSRTGRLHLYVAEAAFDLFHGVQTRGLVRHRNVGTFEHAMRYEATRRSRLKQSLAALPIRPTDFTFVDIGCGRGLVLLLAAQRGYRRIIGVELSDELCDVARENARAFSGSEHGASLNAIQVVHADAAEWELPVEPLVVYVYNPFARPAFEAFAANLSRSILAHPRQLFLIYMFPESRTALDAIQELEVIGETPHYVLYRSVV